MFYEKLLSNKIIPLRINEPNSIYVFLFFGCLLFRSQVIEYYLHYMVFVVSTFIIRSVGTYSHIFHAYESIAYYQKGHKSDMSGIIFSTN
jgi:hypothetical protein